MISAYFNIMLFLLFISGIVVVLYMTNVMAIYRGSMKLKVVKSINTDTFVVNKK